MTWLFDEFIRCRESQTLATVVLRSPTGYGKTTEVCEFYEELASEQHDGLFWPPRLDIDSRKAILPSKYTPMEGSQLSYLWLGLQAQMDRSGRTKFAGSDLCGQLETIAEPLAKAVLADERVWRDRTITLLRTVTSLTVVTLFPVGETIQALKEFSEIAKELADLIPDMLEQSTRRGRRTARALRAGRGKTVIIDGSRQSGSYAKLAGQILAAASSVVPTVVAVEDAQFLDGHTIQMLRSWVQSEPPAGMLILTEATDRSAVGHEWADWLDELENELLTIIQDVDPWTDMELDRIAVERLREEEPGSSFRPDLLVDIAEASRGNRLC